MPRSQNAGKPDLLDVVGEEFAAETAAQWRSSTRRRAVLHRVANGLDAKEAWRQLTRKVQLDEAKIRRVSRTIAELVSDWAESSDLWQPQTRAEIKSAGAKAAKLARELAGLMYGYESLRIAGHDVADAREIACTERLLYGGAMMGLEFPPEIEEEANTWLHANFPKQAPMTTSQAYRGMRAWFADATGSAFQARLLRFAALADASVVDRPSIQVTRHRLAKYRVLGVNICRVFNQEVGAPCIDQATALVAATSPRLEIDRETVKKWWRTRGKTPNFGRRFSPTGPE